MRIGINAAGKRVSNRCYRYKQYGQTINRFVKYSNKNKYKSSHNGMK